MSDYFCLYCGAKLDFKPTEDGGFCSTECEDSHYETFGVEEENLMNNVDDLKKQIVDLENEIEKLEGEAREYGNEILDLKDKIDDMQGKAYNIYKM